MKIRNACRKEVREEVLQAIQKGEVEFSDEGNYMMSWNGWLSVIIKTLKII